MLFQKSLNSDLYYDIISLTKVDGNGSVHREVVKTAEEIPASIKDNFTVKDYAEVTGKKLPGNHLVTLTRKDEEKDMITLFILERARTLPPEERQKSMDLLGMIKEMQKTSITEVGNIVSETFNIDRAALDRLLAELETEGKLSTKTKTSLNYPNFFRTVLLGLLRG